MRTKGLSRSRIGNAVSFTFLLSIGLFIILPIYFSIINALKPISELFLFPPRFIVYNPTLENFLGIFRVQAQSLIPAERYLFNSIFVTVASTAGYVLIASMAAYPLAKHKFTGKKVLQKIIIFAILFRPEVTSLPQYMLMARMGILDSFWALILPHMAGSFGVFLMAQFMSSVPDEILESAKIDGAGDKYIFFKIVFPSVKPAWLTLIIFTFIGSWATAGSQFTYSESMKLLPTMMAQINSGGIIRAGVSAAVAVLLMIPPIVVFLFSQNSVIETMAYSGIKS